MKAAALASTTTDWRELRPADLDAVMDLHTLSLGDAGPDVVKPENRDFFAGLLGGRGRLLGLYAPDLVAYGVLQHDVLAHDDPRGQLGYGPHVRIAKLAGAAVSPAWRGRGLQRALIERRLALAPAPDLWFSTAAPANTVSWTNLLAEGFAIRALVTRYGGLKRYLMVREQTPTPTSADRTRVPVADLDRQHALLDTGWRGIAAVVSGNTRELVFAAPIEGRA